MKREFGGIYIANEGFTPESAEKLVASGEADAVSFGRLFIANPDLPERIKRGGPLNALDVTTLYGNSSKGYTDYPALNPTP